MYYGDLIYPGDMPMNEGVYEELHEAWGGPVTDEKIALAREEMGLSDSGEKASASFEDMAAAEVHFMVAIAGMNRDRLNERIENLSGELAHLSSGSYEYRVASKEWSMLQELNEPHGFFLIRAWRGMFDFIEPVSGVIFLSTLILLGLTPVFADEYTKRTADLILATKHGKRRIVSVKIMAAITYIFVLFILLHFVNLVFQWGKFGGFQGWNAPIQSLPGGLSIDLLYEQSPYGWEVWQFFILSFTIQFFACVAFGILVLFLSVVWKNSMIAFFISGALLGIPFMIQQIGLNRGAFQYVSSFNYSELMKAATLFEQFKVYNVLGYPILYPPLILGIFLVLTSVLTYLIYYRFRYQQVVN